MLHASEKTFSWYNGRNKVKSNKKFTIPIVTDLVVCVNQQKSWQNVIWKEVWSINFRQRAKSPHSQGCESARLSSPACEYDARSRVVWMLGERYRRWLNIKST